MKTIIFLRGVTLIAKIQDPVPTRPARQSAKQRRPSFWQHLLGQLLRFGMVGGINTILDLLILNSLFWLFPTSNLFISLVFNSLAYSVGAVNSFLLNKYWTFEHRHGITRKEVSRFAVTTLLGIGCNDLLLWCASIPLSHLIDHSHLWMNIPKIIAIAGTVLISYLGMRLWVFTNRTRQR
jgi:putative flippase GtrA